MNPNESPIAERMVPRFATLRSEALGLLREQIAQTERLPSLASVTGLMKLDSYRLHRLVRDTAAHHHWESVTPYPVFDSARPLTLDEALNHFKLMPSI